MHTELERPLGPLPGMRYGHDVWLLRPNRLFVEKSLRVLNVQPKRPGQTPRVPSLKVAVEGIRACYGLEPVMGTDPEFFLLNGGGVVPAFDYLPDKHASADGLFWDGFQAETLVDPRVCYGWCLKGCPNHKIKHNAVLAQKIGVQLQKLAAKGLDVACQSTWRIPPLMLKLASDAHVALGCDPSRNAYGSEGRRVERPRELNWRFAGGHVHFELPLEECEPTNTRYLVKTLDALLGLPSVCLAQNYDHFIRRRYYGLAGEYRLPPHGLEYRTLSNFWLMHPRAFGLVFDLARHALNLGRSHLKSVFIGADREQSIRDTINYCDVRSAKDFMHLNREFYSAWATMQYGSDKAFWMAIQGGLDKVIANWGQNVAASWRLPTVWKEIPTWKDLG